MSRGCSFSFLFFLNRLLKEKREMEETAAASPSNETGTVLQRLSRPLRDLDWKEARDAAANGVQKAVASTVEGMERATKALRESIGGRHSDQIARAVVVGSATTAVALLIYGSSKLLRYAAVAILPLFRYFFPCFLASMFISRRTRCFISSLSSFCSAFC